MRTCCDSLSRFIQPPTPLCTCHLLLCPLSMRTSEEAGCPLHPLQSATSWISVVLQVCNLSVKPVIDSRRRGPSHCLSNYQATWGRSEAALCDISSECSSVSGAAFDSSQEASSVSSPSPPLVLLLLPLWPALGSLC